MSTTIKAILDCGHLPSTSSATAGYGHDAQGKTYCYDCCAKRELDSMRQTGKATLYLTTRSDGKRIVSDWPGHLSFPVHHETRGHHNIAGTRYDVWFTVDSRPWHGTQYGDMTQIVHCRRTRG